LRGGARGSVGAAGVGGRGAGVGPRGSKEGALRGEAARRRAQRQQVASAPRRGEAGVCARPWHRAAPRATPQNSPPTRAGRGPAGLPMVSIEAPRPPHWAQFGTSCRLHRFAPTRSRSKPRQDERPAVLLPGPRPDRVGPRPAAVRCRLVAPRPGRPVRPARRPGVAGGPGSGRKQSPPPPAPLPPPRAGSPSARAWWSRRTPRPRCVIEAGRRGAGEGARVGGARPRPKPGRPPAVGDPPRPARPTIGANLARPPDRARRPPTASCPPWSAAAPSAARRRRARCARASAAWARGRGAAPRAARRRRLPGTAATTRPAGRGGGEGARTPRRRAATPRSDAREPQSARRPTPSRPPTLLASLPAHPKNRTPATAPSR
jgi:hypothetical protein